MKINFDNFRTNTVRSYNALIETIEKFAAIEDSSGEMHISIEAIKDELDQLGNHLGTLLSLEAPEQNIKAIEEVHIQFLDDDLV